MTTGGIELEQSLGFQLKLLQVEADARAREALSPFDITPARVSALMMIKSNPGCTQTALGDALSVNRASAMKIVNYLEGRGFVERQTSADPRANALQLTDSGRTELDAMTRALHTSDQQTLARLSASEAELLLRLIHKLRTAA